MSHSLRQRFANSLGVTHQTHCCYEVPGSRSAPGLSGVVNESARIPGGIRADPYLMRFPHLLTVSFRPLNAANLSEVLVDGRYL
jgi:hypothetical protein